MALFLGSHGSHSARQWLYWKLEFHIIYHSPQVDLEAQIYGYKLIVGLWVAKKVCVAFDIYNTCIITICNAGYFRVVCIFKKLWNQLMIHKHSSQTWVRNWHQTKITTHWSVALIIDQPSQNSQSSHVYTFTALCHGSDLAKYCHHKCFHLGDMVGLMVEGVDSIFNVSVTVYQHLQCPGGLYGPGCEQKCECAKRETCHFIAGCSTGKVTSYA